MPFALIAAVMASLGIHAVALFVPEIDLSPAPEPLPLQAEIVLQPRRAPSPPAVGTVPPKPVAGTPSPARKPPAKVSADPPAVPLPQPGPAPAAAVPAATVEAPSPGPAQAVPPDLSSPELPAKGSIGYVVLSGDANTLVGNAEQRWEMADGRYRITSVMETSGLVALIRPVRVETESSGRLTESGLQPEQYVSRRIGRERTEQVRFDWPAGLARFGSGAEAKLPPGAQDLLSFNYQLGWLAKTGDMTIATGRKLGSYRLELIGKEWLDTPAGPIWALHFRASGETTTEVWLAEDRHLLPVKIRHIDKKGERYEQVAREIRLNETE